MKIKLHFLFFITLILSAIFGGLTIFLICVLTALMHECGHIFCAAKLGYQCEKVSLMPFGASAYFELDGISARDEIKLALAGPFVNLTFLVALAALWWFYPVTYAYTDLLFYANGAMLLCNLIPAYPLDGGRIARRAASHFLSGKICEIVVRLMTALSVVAIVLIYFLVYKNLSLLLFAAFLTVSIFEKNQPTKKIDYSKRKVKRGRDIRYVMLDRDATFKDGLRFLNGEKYVIFQIYDTVFLDEVGEEEFFEKLQLHGIYDRVYDENSQKIF